MATVINTIGAEASVLGVLPYGIVVLRPDLELEYVNPAARRLLALLAPTKAGQTSSGLPLVLKQRIAETASLPASFKVDGIQMELVAAADDRRVLSLREDSAVNQELASERQRRAAAESTAGDRREFIAAVLDNIPTGIVVCDESGTIKLFNQATRTFHGLSEASVAADDWAEYYDLYYPDGVTPLRKEDIPLYRALQGEVVRDVEFVIAPRNGVRRTLLASGRAMFGQDGRKLGAMVAMRDITHRKLSTYRVQEAFRQFRTLFNDAPIAYHEIDCEGIIRRVNRSECSLLGRTRDEILGRHAWEFVAESEQEESKKAIVQKMAGLRRLTPAEREYVGGDGNRILVELHENHIVDHFGRIVGIRTAMLDTTDRKKNEQQAQAIVREIAAREQAEADAAEVRSILERIGDAYMAFDADWRYTYVNGKAAELARKPASELLGKRVWDEFPESVHTPFFTEMQRAFNEQISVTFENHYAPLGKWFENTVYPSPAGVSVFYRDITDRKKVHQTLEQRTAELAQKNAELEAFASMASHDLQEPLRAIRSYTGLLSKRYSGVLDEDADTFIQYSVEAANRMQERISALLALCRAGRADPDLIQAISASAALQYAARDVAASVEESGAKLEWDSLPQVQVVESHLVQVFQNLLANAIKYRSQAPPVIRISAKRAGEAWQFSISDNGSGFEMCHSDLIFRPFKRLRRDRPGTGIGLAICKKIVETRGGRIWAESTPDVGSTFHFTIPDQMPDAEREL